MPRRAPLHRAAAVAMCCLLLQASAAIAGRWYEDYEQAVQLIDAEVCSPEAIELLGAAVVDKPEPRMNARMYAQRRVNYLPYYQLARAHQICGNLDLARKYVADSRRFGVAPSDALEVLELKLTRLEQQAQAPAPATVDPAEIAARVERTQTQLDRATAARTELESLVGDREVAEALLDDSSWGERQRHALATLQSASGRLRRGVDSADPIVIADAGVLAAEAAAELTALTADLRRERQRRLDDRASAARDTPAPVAVAAALPTAPPSSRQPAVATSAESRPSAPAAVRRAAMLFLGGQYDEVVTALADDVIEPSPELAGAYLLRAAARDAMARRTGDARLAEEAGADLATARSLGPELAPDPRWFSPAFRARWAATPAAD